MSDVQAQSERGLHPLIPESDWITVDFPGLAVAVAEYAEGPTRCTVLALDRMARLPSYPRRNTRDLQRSGTTRRAVCLARASILGLQAATGVAASLCAQRGSDPLRLPAVVGGVIYDFAPKGRSGV